MSNLLADWLTRAPSFTQIRLDVFGPWSFCARRTRGGLSESAGSSCLPVWSQGRFIKRWWTLSASNFINALRRLTAMRGPAKLFCWDRGINFVGTCKELRIRPENAVLKSYLKELGCTREFNLPHSSDMGGVGKE